MKVKPLAWDSHFFKKQVGEVFVENEKDKISNFEEFDLLYLLASKPINITIPGFTNAFHDTKVVFSKFLIKASPVKNNNVISVFDSEFSEEKLYPLALLSGTHSRFKKDPNFTSKEFKNLYKKWIDNSFQKLIAHDIFVYVDKNDVLGFVTFQVNKKKGTIGLIAVYEKAQGKGVGAALISHVEAYLINKNISQLHIPTQSTNTIACKFYEKLGYQIKESNEIYHFWKI